MKDLEGDPGRWRKKGGRNRYKEGREEGPYHAWFRLMLIIFYVQHI